jgi:hypothetical protein
MGGTFRRLWRGSVTLPLMVLSFTLVLDHASAQVKGASDEISVDRVADRLFFKIGATSTEYLTKWLDDVHVGLMFDSPVKPQFLEKLGGYLSLIQETTQHSVTVRDKTNFLMIFSSNLDETLAKHSKEIEQFFTDRGSFQNFLTLFKDEHRTCGSKVLLSPNRAVGAYLLIVLMPGESVSVETDECALRGVLKGMGLIGGAGATVTSSFVLHDGDDRLSASDRTVLSVLYSPKLAAGSTKEAALPIIANLVQQISGTK